MISEVIDSWRQDDSYVYKNVSEIYKISINFTDYTFIYKSKNIMRRICVFAMSWAISFMRYHLCLKSSTSIAFRFLPAPGIRGRSCRLATPNLSCQTLINEKRNLDDLTKKSEVQFPASWAFVVILKLRISVTHPRDEKNSTEIIRSPFYTVSWLGSGQNIESQNI